jgi:hypothetical protein
MRTRIYRYDQPEASTLLDIVNFTNKSKFKLDQLTFSTPEAKGYVHTHLLVKDSRSPTFDGAVELYYSRYDLATTFSENPLVVDTSGVNDGALFTAIFEQQRVMFERAGIEIIRTPLSSAIFDNIIEGISLEAVINPTSIPQLPEIDRDGNYNFTVRAKPGSLIWVGETSLLVRPTAELLERSIMVNLAVRQYLTETKDTKTPIELIYAIEKDASQWGEVFAERIKTGDSITDVSPFIDIARQLTGDNWVGSGYKANFNLQGSTVLYNGYNSGEFVTDYPEFSHILVICLGDLCRNLKGIWTIQYNDPTVFKYDQCRVDSNTRINPL